MWGSTSRKVQSDFQNTSWKGGKLYTSKLPNVVNIVGHQKDIVRYDINLGSWSWDKTSCALWGLGIKWLEIDFRRVLNQLQIVVSCYSQ